VEPSNLAASSGNTFFEEELKSVQKQRGGERHLPAFL
jgi:hypothetical protein